MTPLQFASDHQALWDRLEAALLYFEGSRSGRAKSKASATTARTKASTVKAAATEPDAAHMAQLYRQACEHLALARARDYPVHLTQRLEDLTHRAHQLIYHRSSASQSSLTRTLLVDVPQAVRAHRGPMWLATLVFALPLLVLGLVTYFNPDFVLTVHDATEVARFERMYAEPSMPLGRERTADTDWQMFGHYIMNNISVAFRCFAGGIFLGVGSLFFLGYNGVVAGAIAGYLAARGHGENFFSFVVTHGAFELTAIVISGAAGLALGQALVAPGRRTRVEALRHRAQGVVPLLYGCIAMLVIAAGLEAFWSSSRWVPPTVKYLVGGLCWALVLAYLGWQGKPAAPRRSSSAAAESVAKPVPKPSTKPAAQRTADPTRRPARAGGRHAS